MAYTLQQACDTLKAFELYADGQDAPGHAELRILADGGGTIEFAGINSASSHFTSIDELEELIANAKGAIDAGGGLVSPPADLPWGMDYDVNYPEDDNRSAEQVIEDYETTGCAEAISE